MNKILFSSIAIIFSALPIFSAARFPFPQNTTNSYGIQPNGALSEDVQQSYEVFIKNYYEERGDLARIKWNDSTKTVSEGIAYGMLATVYMDNSKNNTQSKFDKLWKYYNSFLNNRGLMNWKIRGYDSIAELNAASDAELDAAVALLMAYQQWGEDHYLADAKILTGKIWKYEINRKKYLKPGDAWDDKKNPSYFSIVAFKLFREFDTVNDWAAVIRNSYVLIKASQDSITGLVPDWCSESGDDLETNFSYDAIRTPWRMAWAYAWFGDKEAKEIAGKMAGWISKETKGNPSEIGNGYQLDGKRISNFNSATFVSCFACAGIVDTTYQSWCDTAYSKLKSFSGNDGYFSESLQVLTMLLMSGNMPLLGSSSAVYSIPNQHAQSDYNVTFGVHNNLLSFKYSLARSSNITLAIYNSAGQKVIDLYSGYCKQGTYTTTLNSNQIKTATGMLLVRLVTPSQISVCPFFNVR